MAGKQWKGIDTGMKEQGYPMRKEPSTVSKAKPSITTAQAASPQPAFIRTTFIDLGQKAADVSIGQWWKWSNLCRHLRALQGSGCMALAAFTRCGAFWIIPRFDGMR